MSKILKELEKFANDRVLDSEARTVLFKKLAFSGIDRKSVNKMLSDSQKAYAKARAEYNEANSQLSSLQERADKAQAEMASARKSMLEINHAAQTMDLVGAEGLKQEKGGEYSYVVDGDRHYADTSDFENIKLTPWKEYLASKNESDDGSGDSDSEESEEVLVSSDDVFNELNSKIEEKIESEEGIVEEAVDPDEEEDFEDEGDTNDSSYASDFSYAPYAWAASNVEKSIITKVAKKKFR